MEPPIAERHSHDVIFGIEPGKNKGRNAMKNTIIKKDYYYWLRDDSRKSKKVLKYLEDENKYTDFILSKGILPIKNKIASELRKNMIEDYDTIELPEGIFGFESPYRFYAEYNKGKSYPIYSFKKDNKKHIYLDPNDLKKEHKTLDVNQPVFSPDLSIVGYGIDTNGSEKYNVILKTFPDLQDITHNIPPVLYSNFLLSNNSIYYVAEDEANRPYQLRKYELSSGKDILLYEEKNVERQVEIEPGNNFDCVICRIQSYNESAAIIFWFDNKKFCPRKIKKNLDYDVKIFQDYLLIKTNTDNQKNYNIMFCKIKEQIWQNLIPYDESVFLEQIDVVKDGVILSCRTNGQQYIRYLKLDSQMNIIYDNIYCKFDGGYFMNLVYSHFSSSKIIYFYQDFVTPKTYYELDLNSGLQIEIKKMKTKNFNPGDYKVERVFVGEVPVDILMKKDFKKDGSSNCLLYGYGCYGLNVEIKFDEKLFPLIDRGFIYVIANTRGSSYLGKIFYEDGKMLKKMNTFKDFIKVSEFLIENKYCAPDKLNIEGRSAGGLLVSAVALMRPELYRNVLAGVPFVDVLVTMADASIPLTTGEWLQVGNTNVKRHYDYIKKYSPMDNILSNSCYPNFYINAGLNDPRVAYWEPAKFVANLRYHQAKNCDTIIVLKTNMESGHFSSTDRYKYLDEIAERYAFIIKN